MRADGGGGGGCSGAAASKLSAGSAAAAMFGLAVAAAATPSIAGKKLASARDDAELAHVAVERSITPRWIRIEGNTLSAKMGRCEVCGMGNGEGPEGTPLLFAPKRMTIEFIRKSAFLKQ